MRKTFPFYKQPDKMDCGPCCLRMVAKYHGRNFKMQMLRRLCETSKDGVSLLGISNAAEKIGLRSLGVRLGMQDLHDIDLPALLHWRQSHFVVLHRIRKSTYQIADPAVGLVTLSSKELKESWLTIDGNTFGVALVLSPTPIFYEGGDEQGTEIRWSFLLNYLVAYKQLFFQLFLGLCLASALQLITPFLTQSIIDIGINTRNLNFVYVIIAAQAMLVIGRVSIEFIRSWILLHITTRVNVSILTDFLIKLMKLPISFFDTKMTGDIMQRMNDQRRIESFLTGSALNTLFSTFNLIVFSFVLAYYDASIFFVFLFSNLIYGAWIVGFLKRRRTLNYQSFDISSKNQSSIVQLVNGMQEIKLNNAEQHMRWEWEHLQARLFKFNVKSLALNQYQQGGASLISETTNLLITFLSAKAVIQGDLTLGGMMALQYIVGQLNSPIQQFLGFIQSFQDAKISLERLNEIHQIDDEEPPDKVFINELPTEKSIQLNNVSFRYPGAGNESVLKEVNLFIPEGKTTAIVGMSGSGKTTILKLLLRFYEPNQGNIEIGGHPLDLLSPRIWRSECGIVMQDGFIFSDTIGRNIAVGDDYPDKIRLNYAIKVANISDLIESLPLGINTKIGAEGNGISQGQWQRILIARAVYKEPKYIFFDEATNALDANNEKVILNNLQAFFKGRTVVIVAHRLSTVRHAENIIVLDKGRIIEQGTHEELASKRGSYYNLVKNQLELGD